VYNYFFKALGNAFIKVSIKTNSHGPTRRNCVPGSGSIKAAAPEDRREKYTNKSRTPTTTTITTSYLQTSVLTIVCTLDSGCERAESGEEREERARERPREAKSGRL